ncbi:hypothetical protein J4573_38395 [Actinomadura barringtoniae]|uniref:Uncharacterized protein n=1 Tax=Actinomadura barringtoniae TaxID=1427535 RepID=A0A939PI15_9ACTN|nr:hypothetical protein [Actinomadura barringtoniae]MBO2453015.1 hypothetical protein [Actinomadura barringtoniae]
MNKDLFRRIMLALSICYGVLVGVMAMFDSGATGLVAIIGAIVIGILWTLFGMFSRPTKA